MQSSAAWDSCYLPLELRIRRPTIRYLGAGRSGYLLSLQALIGLNVLVGGFGLATPAVRRVAVLHSQQDFKTARDIVSSVAILNVATTAPIALLIVACFSIIFVWTRLDVLYRQDAFFATVLVCASFVIGQISAAFQSSYDALQRYDLISVLTTVFGLATGITGIIVLRVSPSMTAVAATGFVISLVRLLCDGFFVRRLLGAVLS